MNGYQIVDLKDTTLSETGTKVSGVYESLKNSNRKPILLTGIVIDGIKLSSAFVQIGINNGDYVIPVYARMITIKPDDTVTEIKEN